MRTQRGPANENAGSSSKRRWTTFMVPDHGALSQICKFVLEKEDKGTGILEYFKTLN